MPAPWPSCCKLASEPDRLARLPPLALEIDQGLVALGGSPLSSPALRASLAAAREQAQRLCQGLGGAGAGAAAGAGAGTGLDRLAQASDRLLDILDQLTADFEHSLQLIMA